MVADPDAIARGLELQRDLPKPWRPQRRSGRRDGDAVETAGGLATAITTLGPSGLMLGGLGIVVWLLGKLQRRPR